MLAQNIIDFFYLPYLIETMRMLNAYIYIKLKLIN